jgi:hypothetical protein
MNWFIIFLLFLLQIQFTTGSDVKTKFELVKGLTTFLLYLEGRLAHRSQKYFFSNKFLGTNNNAFYFSKFGDKKELHFWTGIQTHFSVHFPENCIFLQIDQDRKIFIDANPPYTNRKTFNVYSNGFILCPSQQYFKFNIRTAPLCHDIIFYPYTNPSKHQLIEFNRLLKRTKEFENFGEYMMMRGIRKKKEKLPSWAIPRPITNNKI